MRHCILIEFFTTLSNYGFDPSKNPMANDIYSIVKFRVVNKKFNVMK